MRKNIGFEKIQLKNKILFNSHRLFEYPLEIEWFTNFHHNYNGKFNDLVVSFCFNVRLNVIEISILYGYLSKYNKKF